MGNIINRILLEFLTLVVIGNLVAWPVSYFAIRKWLARFPYTIGIHLSYFIVAGLIAVLISATTILYIVLKSAASDPVESLRYE